MPPARATPRDLARPNRPNPLPHLHTTPPPLPTTSFFQTNPKAPPIATSPLADPRFTPHSPLTPRLPTSFSLLFRRRIPQVLPHPLRQPLQPLHHLRMLGRHVLRLPRIAL